MKSKVGVYVKRALAASADARNNDTELLIHIMEQKGAYLSEFQKNILRSFSFESVRRTRQKLQEEGQYLPSPEVAKKRRLKSYIVQQNMPTTSSDKVPDLIEAPVPKAIPWMND